MKRVNGLLGSVEQGFLEEISQLKSQLTSKEQKIVELKHELYVTHQRKKEEEVPEPTIRTDPVRNLYNYTYL